MPYIVMALYSYGLLYNDLEDGASSVVADKKYTRIPTYTGRNCMGHNYIEP